ncbi:MAG: IPTL-CTERM sorting domain-containing protein [Pseudomonadota bacterium]
MKTLNNAKAMVFAILIFIIAAPAGAEPLDLGGFAPDPISLDYPGTSIGNTLATISLDSIIIHEDASHGWWSIYVANDSLQVPAGSPLFLQFDYSLVLGPWDYDWLVFTIDDVYLLEVEGNNSLSGSPLTVTGHASIDMAGYSGSFISMAFGIEADWEDSALTSLATFSNIRVGAADIPTVNEWGMILLAGALVFLSLSGMKRGSV